MIDGKAEIRQPIPRRRVLAGGLAAAAAALLPGCGLFDSAPLSLPPYTLRPGDTVRIDVYDHEELSVEAAKLDGGGFVNLPYVGPTALDGLTLRAAEARVAARLSPDFVRNPVIGIALVEHAPIYVLGEVRRPGRFDYREGMTAREAIALARGYTARAPDFYLFVIRPQPDGPPKELWAEPDTPLLPGDGVHVPTSWF
jgi:polysaccharide export outer membrane protein